MTAAVRGIVPPVVTPLTDAGEVDVPSLRRLVRRLVDAGVHGVFALGSSSEVAYLDASQRRLVLDEVITEVGGAVPVLAGCIEMTSARVVESVHAVEEAGASAVVVTAPFYAITDDRETEAHFRSIAAATALDVWAYDIPVRVHQKLPADLLVRLGVDGVLAGVKDSSGDDVAFRRLVAKNEAAGHPLSVLTGHEVVVDGMLLLGADGAVPGLANVDPARYVALWNAARAGDWRAVEEAQNALAALFEIVFIARGHSIDSAGVGAFKAALAHLGVFESRAMAHPVRTLESDVARKIAELVEQSGVPSVGATVPS